MFAMQSAPPRRSPGQRRTVQLAVLSVASTALMLADDFLHQLFTPNNHAQLEASYVLVLWFVNLLLWLSGSRAFAGLVIAGFALMQLIQLTHISMMGSPLTPYDIGRAGQEWGEIHTALATSLGNHWYLPVVWALPWLGVLLLFQRQLHTVTARPNWIPVLMVALILGSKPERALRRDMIAFMPGPTRSSLHNSINAFSFYAARIVGRDASFRRPAYEPYRLVPAAAPAQAAPSNIVLVVADSLRHDRLQVNGYHRATTPFLTMLKESGQLDTRQGIAASVATGASLPLLFNVVREPGHVDMIERKTANLFRAAKAAGYKTFWLSSQESKNLNDVGVDYIDVIRTQEDFPVDVARQGDQAIIGQLGDKDWGERNFIVIFTRSAHSPYEENYDHAAENEKWDADSHSLPVPEKLGNAYDNSVFFLDRLLEKKLALLKQSLQGNSLLVFTADHGQMLGESGMWGHNRLYPTVASVPVLMHQWSTTPAATRYALPDNDYVSHYELGSWLLGLMGFELINPQQVADAHYLQGTDIYADNMYRKVTESEAGLHYCDTRQVSGYGKADSC